MGHGDDDDGLHDVVPVPIAQTVARRVREQLPTFTLEGLKGAQVRVRANGFDYRGVLVGADEHELYLRGELRWVVLPLADVTEVRPEPPAPAAPPRRRGDP
ncbi:MAG: hypothetical protein IT383_16620 [Deltaproteobacteria bacterium]|nr:hypothetical protein [Deltaproteobacteria bacterium]